MRTIDQVSLRSSWKSYYDAFAKKMVADEEIDAKSRAFNGFLKEKLTLAQKSGTRFSQEEVYQICSSITRRVYDLGVVDIKSFDLKALSIAVQGADFVPLLSCTDQAGNDYDFVHVHCLGHIPLDGLTDKEISLLMECFVGDISEQWNTLIFMVLDIKMNSFERYKKNIEKIVSLSRNATFNAVNHKVLERYKIDLGFSSSFLSKVQDYFTLRSI